MDNTDAARSGATVTRYSGSGNLTGLNIYNNRLITRHEDSGPITNSDLGQCDKNSGNECNDDDLHFDVTTSTNVMTVDNDWRLYIWSGTTFSPGATTTLATGGTAFSMGGDLKFGSSTSILNATSNTIFVGGDWINDAGGTFSKDTNQLVVMNATTTGFTMSGTMTGSSAFEKLQFNGTSTSAWTIQDALKVSATTTDALVQNYGTVTLGNSANDNLEVDGGWKIANTANETSTFQTFAINQASGTITIFENATSQPSCPNCVITLGAASGSGQGSFLLNKNAILELIPRATSTASDAGLEASSTGYLQIQGSQDATNTVLSIAEDTNSSTITVAGSPWSAGLYDGEVVRVMNTSSLAFGKIYDIASTTASTIRFNATTTPRDSAPNVNGGAACTGNATCTITLSITDAITANNNHVGRYLHNITQSKYYLIVKTDQAASDTLDIVTNEPDDFTTMNDNDTVEITDGLRATDIFEILDYAHVTAEAGTACSATVNEAGEGYIWAKAGSETLIRYADICNLGRNIANKVGIRISTVNDANTDEGFTMDKSRAHSGNYGIYMETSRNNTLTDSNLYSNASNGIYLYSAADSNTVTKNRIYSNSNYGINLTTARFNTLTWNQTYANSSMGIYLSVASNGNTLIRNSAFNNVNRGINLDTSVNNSLSKNKAYGGQQQIGLAILNSSNNNTISGNNIFANTIEGIYIYNSSKNTFAGNTIYSTGGFFYGIEIELSSNNIFSGNNIYNNQYGFNLKNFSPNNYSVSDTFGSSTPNRTADIKPSTATSTLFLYGSRLLSTTEVVLPVSDGNFFISRSHDGLATSTKIWGNYTVPTDITETPQNESYDRFNYANNTWEKSATAHGYSGTGSEDSNLDYDLASSSLSAGPYAYRLVASVAGACTATSSWSVYRSDSTGNENLVGTSTCATQFVDSNGGVNVKFKIDGGAPTAYAIGSTYTFVVWDASNNTATQKFVDIQQADDTITVPSGTTLESKGGGGGADQFTNWTFAPGGANQWSFANSGTSTVQESKMANLNATTSALTVLNTQLTGTGFPKVSGNGTLNVDWYLSAHVVDAAATSTNIDTATNDIKISEPSGSSTVFKMSSGAWESGVSSTLTETDAGGHIPQPNTDGSIRLREYSKTSSATTTYSYNIAVDPQPSYFSFDYFNDAGGNYITSVSSTAAGAVDKTIGNLWYRDTLATEGAHPVILNDPPVNGTFLAGLQGVALSFVINSLTLPDGLAGYWPMDEGTGTSTKDISGSGHTGTLTLMADPPTATSGWTTSGKLNKALNFDGVNDYVGAAGGGGLNNLQTGTISMWVRWSGTQGGDAFSNFGDVIARQKNGSFSNDMISLSTSDPSTAKIRWFPYGNGVAITGNTTVGNNTWRHVVITFASGTHALYLDGVNDGTGATTGSMADDATIPASIGAWIGDGGGYSRSTIDEVRVYNRILTQSEITTLYNLTSPVDATLALTAANNLTATSATVFTVTTNASNGYNLTAYETGLMAKGASTIDNWMGTNAVPTEWSTNCTASSTQCGFGYRTDDADLSQFNTSTLFAGFVTSTPGDVVAKSTATTTNDATTLTYKMSVDNSKSPGVYSTTVRYILTPVF